MNLFFKVLKISAKKTFEEVKKKSPFFIKNGDNKAYITKKLWNHLHFEKDRPLQDLMLRLLIFPLFDIIFKEGIITFEDDLFLRLEYSQKNITFCIICKKNGKEYIVLSCFIDNKKHPVLAFNGNSPHL